MSDVGWPETISFGEFELDRGRFELRRGGVPLHLERQVFDLLAYLILARGRVVSKQELLDNVWGTRFVTAAALTTQIKVARRALEDDGQLQRYIRTVHRRGYQFVGVLHAQPRIGPSTGVRRALVATDRVDAGHDRSRLDIPRVSDRLVGRAAAIVDLERAVVGHAVVTVVGPGGVGKTRLVVEVIPRIAHRFVDGVFFVDLSGIGDGDDLPRAVAERTGITDAVRGVGIADNLADLDALIVLDNCEHVIDAAASFVNRLTAARDDRVHVLVTTREALDVPGEHVQRLAPLPTNPAAGGSSEAAELFYDRSGLVAGPDSAELVNGIVDLLDGLPLAIELAAAQLQFMTVSELQARLDSRRLSLSAMSSRRHGRRNRSIASTIEWSWELLDHVDQQTLVQLAVFPTSWRLDAAEAVVALRDGESATASIGRLHAKSLIATDRVTAGSTRLRLLFGVKEYVRAQQVRTVGGPRGTRDRHAAWCVDWTTQFSFEDQWVSIDYVDGYLLERANISQAIDHCVHTGDPTAAATLVAASAPLFRYGIGVAQGRGWTATLEPADLPPALSARHALAGAEVAYAMGDLVATQRHAERAIDATTGRQNIADVRAAALVMRSVGRTLTTPSECIPRLRAARDLAHGVGATRIEAIALGLLGFAELMTERDTDRAFATASEASRLSAAPGWHQFFTATLSGAAQLLAGDGQSAATEFSIRTRLTQRVGRFSRSSPAPPAPLGTPMQRSPSPTGPPRTETALPQRKCST